MIKDSSGNQRFYGVYRGVVFDNKDPNSLNRLRLNIPQVFATVPTGWSWPTNPAGVRTSLPEIGQGVWVMFEGGDPSFPMWMGVFGNEVSSDTTVAIKPAAKGTILPYNISVASNTDGSNSIDLVKSLISVASVIDGGSA
jgi:hypothetical protein